MLETQHAASLQNLSSTVAQPPSAVAFPKANRRGRLCHKKQIAYAILPAAFFGSTCPPNFCLMADKVFSANVCSWRERKRVYKAAVSTSAGTAVAIAASI